MGKKASADLGFEKLVAAFSIFLLFFGTFACHRKSRETIRNLEARVLLLELKIRNNEERLKTIEEMLLSLNEAEENRPEKGTEQKADPAKPDPDLPPPTRQIEGDEPGLLAETEPSRSPEEPETKTVPDPSKDPEEELTQPSSTGSDPEIENTGPTAELPAPPKKVVPTTNIGALYKRAMNALSGRRFEEAASGFQTIVTGFPGHRFAPNSYYWLAESFYDRNDYLKAIEYFQAVLDRYPKSGKAPDALLKRGKSKERLGQIEEAFKDYRAVIERFPTSRAAQIAESWL